MESAISIQVVGYLDLLTPICKTDWNDTLLTGDYNV